MNTETIILLIVALASLLALAETLRETFHDGPATQRRPAPTRRTRASRRRPRGPLRPPATYADDGPPG